MVKNSYSPARPAINRWPEWVYSNGEHERSGMNELAARLAAGDSAAFAELYDSCADRLFHYLVVMLASRDDAADVLQDTFVRLVRSKDRMQTVTSPLAYTFRIARNEALRFLRSRSSVNRNLAEHGWEMFEQKSAGETLTHENAEWFACRIAAMSVELREVLQLKIYANMTLNEIANITGSPLGTVATRYRRAILDLRALWIAQQ